MAEDYRVQVSLSLPPAAQYAKGDMLNIRGDSVTEVLAMLDGAISSGLLAKAAEAGKVYLAESGLVQDKPVVADNGATLSQSQSVDNVVNLRTCPHGKMNGPVEGVAKTGRNAGQKYLKWTCPANDRDCKAKFENP